MPILRRFLPLVFAALLCAQDATKEIDVSIDVDANALPAMVRAAYPGLTLAATRELLQKPFDVREMPYTTAVTMRVPPGVTTTQPSFMPLDPNPKTPEAVRVSAAIMKAIAVQVVPPVYPSEAKARRIQGLVALSVTVGKDGKVADARGISGHPLLMEAAQVAVAQWEYKQFIVSDQPVGVVTEVEVTFALQ